MKDCSFLLVYLVKARNCCCCYCCRGVAHWKYQNRVQKSDRQCIVLGLRKFPAVIIIKLFRIFRSRVRRVFSRGTPVRCVYLRRAQLDRESRDFADAVAYARPCGLTALERCIFVLHRVVCVCWISFIKIWKQFVRRRRRRRLALIVRDETSRYNMCMAVEPSTTQTQTHTHAPGASNGTASIDE